MAKGQKILHGKKLDRAIKKYFTIGTTSKGRPVPIPKVASISVVTLNRLADHCEEKGIRMSYFGLRVV